MFVIRLLLWQQVPIAINNIINGHWRGVRQPLFLVFGPMIMIVT